MHLVQVPRDHALRLNVQLSLGLLTPGCKLAKRFSRVLANPLALGGGNVLIACQRAGSARLPPPRSQRILHHHLRQPPAVVVMDVLVLEVVHNIRRRRRGEQRNSRPISEEAQVAVVGHNHDRVRPVVVRSVCERARVVARRDVAAVEADSRALPELRTIARVGGRGHVQHGRRGVRAARDGNARDGAHVAIVDASETGVARERDVAPDGIFCRNQVGQPLADLR